MKGGKTKIIEVPGDVEVSIEGTAIKAKSGKGRIEKRFPTREVGIALKDGKINVYPLIKKKSALAKAATVASIINTMIEGVSGKEFAYKLEVVYSHFPITMSIKERHVEIVNLRGAKRSRIAYIVGDTKVESKGKSVTVKSHDKQAAGQTAANIENATRVVNTDRRVFQDGIYITQKAK